MRAKGLNYASRSRMDNYIDRIKQKNTAGKMLEI